MPHADPGTFLAIRFALAFAILVIVCFILGAQWPNKTDSAHSVIIGILMHGLYLGPVFWSINHGMPAGVSAIIVGLQPLLTTIIAGWILGETVNRRHWIGIIVGLIGVTLVIGPGTQHSGSGINTATLIANFIAVFSITIGTIYQKRNAGHTDLRTGTTLQYLGGFIPVALHALLFEDRNFNVNAESLFALGWLVFVLSFFAVFLLMWLIRQGSVSTVSSLFYLVPVVTTLIAYFLFHETLSPVQLAGMLLCAFAVALASGALKKT